NLADGDGSGALRRNERELAVGERSAGLPGEDRTVLGLAVLVDRRDDELARQRCASALDAHLPVDAGLAECELVAEDAANALRADEERLGDRARVRLWGAPE